MTRIVEAAQQAAAAARAIATLTSEEKNAVLLDLADRIEREPGAVLDANRSDMTRARESGIGDAKQRRLELTEASLTRLAAGLRQVAELPDPVGEVTRESTNAAGLKVRRVRVPLGVVAMIYEARPGVTADAFALCFKAGNACILKGGKEADESNRVIAGLVQASLAACDAPEDAIVQLTTSERSDLVELLKQDQHVDLVIPRGGRPLIEFVHEHSRIPTVQHFEGVCHVYIDDSADIDKAIEICVNGKTSAPATCNATECVLVHKEIAAELIPRLVARLAAEGVEVHGGPIVTSLAPEAKPAAPEDWGREFLDLVLAMRVVASIDEAIEHVQEYSSDHTDAILTTTDPHAERFTREVRSSCVLVNASTRFNDGFELGLGAEIGISTSRVHAYGPMGLEQLTIERYEVRGDWQVRR